MNSLRSAKQIYRNHPYFSCWCIIFSIWLLGAICDRFWYSMDNSVPAWDQADYLNGALNYWDALQNPQWLNSEWWRSFWLLSNKIPPLHYILTTPFLNRFGLTIDAANLVMLVYSAMLLVAVYGLGVILFNRRVGIYAAILCQLLPGLYYYRLEFLLDYPLTAVTVFSFWLLTLWKVTKNHSWLWAITFGLSLGLAVLLKQTALFFLSIPIVWLLVSYLKNLQWLKIWQLVTSILVGIAVCYPWYRTNWLLILTSGKRATIDSAIAEGDPALNTFDAWLYYLKTLPYLLSWHLLLIPVVGILLYLITKACQLNFYTGSPLLIKDNYSIRWLLVYFLGGYLLSSFNINKDARYILPLLPIIALWLAIGLSVYSRKWRVYVEYLTIAFAIVLMLLNLFPLPGANIASFWSPRVQHYPDLQQNYPHQEVIQEIINTDFALRTTLGVLPSTPTINQHNFSFYGGLKKFQVVGRQVGIRENEVLEDMRSLNWFLTKTGDQGSVPEAQAVITKLIQESPNFQIHKTWQLPDRSKLKLYRKIQPDVEISINDRESYKEKNIKLDRIKLPEIATPGQAVPVTYQWIGNSQQLTEGIVLITWKPITNQYHNNQSSDSFWIHDRAIGMGMLAKNYLNSAEFTNQSPTLQVTENTAMLVPQNIPSGQYQLEVTYFNRQTKKAYAIAIPNKTITINENDNSFTKAELNRELDLVTQLSTIAPTMASGITALEPIFTQTARINQYDGKQDYLQQTEIALSYRLQNNQQFSRQQKLDWYYAIALSQVLQQDVRSAIVTWQNITDLAPQNPYNYAYLAFVYLYNWQPKLATMALNKAELINPNIPEIATLQGIAALMQGNIIKAWKLLL